MRMLKHFRIKALLNRYWDDVISLKPARPVPPSDAPAELTVQIRRLHVTEDADSSRPAYEDRLLQQLLNRQQELLAMSTARTETIHTSTSRPRQGPSWYPWKKEAERTNDTGKRWMPIALVCTSLLLVFVVLERPLDSFLRDSNSGHGGVFVPAPGTPSASDHERRVLFEFPVPSGDLLGDEFGGVGVGYYTMAPNSTTTWPVEDAASAEWLFADYLVAGELILTSESDTDVIRGKSGGSVETIPAGTEIVLSPGDSVVRWRSDPIVWVNPGSSEAEIVTVWLRKGRFGHALSWYPPGWTELSLNELVQGPIPDDSYVLRLEQMELEPGAVVPGVSGNSLQFGQVAPGTDAYLARSAVDSSLTLRFADASTIVFVFTFEASASTRFVPDQHVSAY